MIRKIYIDFIKEKLSRGEAVWLFKQGWQYLMTHASFMAGRPLCGPILGTLITNYTCNYHCRMCDLPLRDREFKEQGRHELSTMEMKRLIREFADLGTKGIGFTGGEPLLRKDIFELLAHTKELGMITHLNTNGFYLDEGNIRKVLAAKVDSLNISLDGARPQTHAAVRGFPGAFDRVVDAVRLITRLRRETGSPIRLKLVGVLSEMNIDEVPDMVKLSRELGTDCVEFIPQQPFRTTGDLPVVQDEAFLAKVRRTMDYLLKAKKEGVSIEDSPRMIKLFEKSFRGEPSPLKCYAGYNSLTADCYGEIYPCLPWANWRKSVGPLGEKGLRGIWYSEEYNRVRAVVSRCRDCYLNCQAELNILFNLL